MLLTHWTNSVTCNRQSRNPDVASWWLWIGMSCLAVAVVVWNVGVKPVLDWDWDRAYAVQILDGLNPFDQGLVPRPVSALLLQMPLVWTDTVLLARLSTVAAVVIMSVVAVRVARCNVMWVLPIALTVALSVPVRQSVGSGNAASVVAVLVGVAWLRGWAWPIAVAAALRLYPAAWMFVVGWRRVMLIFGLLMAAGLVLVPDPVGMVQDLAENSDTFVWHPANTSLVAWWEQGIGDSRMVSLVLVVVGGLAAWWASRFPWDRAMSAAAVVGVLVPAVSWPVYHLVLVPAIAWAVSHGRWWVMLVTPLWFSGFGVFTPGGAHLVAAVVIAVGVYARNPPALREEREGIVTL